MLTRLIQNLKNQSWVEDLISKSSVYIVGGCVRDSLMNKPIKDVDLIIEGMPIQFIKQLLSHYGKVSIVGQSFAVIKFRPKDHIGEDYDVAVPRIDRKIGTGHKGFEVETKGVTIIDDLKRRDFTINSIAVNVKNGKMLDPFKGYNDITSHLLRATDKTAFTEDALRIIRGIQFAARFHFDIENSTLNLMKSNANLIKEITGERILEEFEKILTKGGSTKIAFELLEKSNLDKALFRVKFSKEGFKYFDNLDEISFFYTLGNLGGKIPSEFYKNRLKGKANITKALEILERNFDKFDNLSEQDLKWKVFIMLKGSSLLKDVQVLPINVTNIIRDMKFGKIPMKIGDIPVSGNDIMDEFKVKNEEIGNIIFLMYKEALMNKFNWKNKEDSMNYLREYIK